MATRKKAVSKGTAKKTVSQKMAKPTKKTAATAVKGQMTSRSKDSFPIIGIGASAGGLEAFEGFFKAIKKNIDAAFVLVSHLDPTHSSILPELIQKKTSMQVNQVVDNMKIVSNQVYIIPPNREMAILNGTLQLLEMSKPRGANLPIDIFFRSLALDQGDNAIGIILSGTGTDGTLGISAIKGEGGIVLAQDLVSAKYDGMPGSAISTGLVDYILPPHEMPEQLSKYVSHQSMNQKVTPGSDDSMQNALPKIYVILRARTQHDFSLYKKNTICRRIERRMHVHQIDKIDNYVRYLRESEHEISILFRELLIGVTSFFRDPDAFSLLKKNVLDLLKDKPDDDPVRVWVAGCSSGEEAYSIAIIFQECMETLGRQFSVQIFGTDLDEEAINMARAGVYPESIAADVSQERLNKFFAKDENHYQIKKKIREMVVFALQNIIKDPPFTKLDLLSCRNLLIYFGPELQKKLLPIFHYSLKPYGILFLGSSETIGLHDDLFTAKDKKWKLFQRHPSDRGTQPPPHFPTARLHIKGHEKEYQQPVKPAKEINPLKLMQTIISQGDMSTCLVIDDRGTIIYIHGRTGNFLEPAEGEASLNVLEMARPGLKSGLANAIRKMATERQEVFVKGLTIQRNGGHININLIVKPLPDFQMGHRGLMMVIFDETGHHHEQKTTAKPVGKKGTTKSAELINIENELQYTKENLQTTIEELETSNEELKSTNEELQSTNEELQSTNEELETSKEELQSLNEESTTVNSELQSRIDELVSSKDDMKNLLDATEIATIFLDSDLNIRRFTPKVTSLIPLTQIDIGRSITHFATNLKDIDLSKSAQEVLKDLGRVEVEVQDRTGKIYRMRVRPYRTINNVIDGVVITFDDITQLKQLAQENRLAALVQDSNDAILLHDFSGKILAWNYGAKTMYGYSEAEALKMNILDMAPPNRHKEIKNLIARLQEEDVKSLVTERLTKDGKIVHVWLTLSKIKNDEAPELLATTERDLSLLNKEAYHQLVGR